MLEICCIWMWHSHFEAFTLFSYSLVARRVRLLLRQTHSTDGWPTDHTFLGTPPDGSTWIPPPYTASLIVYAVCPDSNANAKEQRAHTTFIRHAYQLDPFRCVLGSAPASADPSSLNLLHEWCKYCVRQMAHIPLNAEQAECARGDVSEKCVYSWFSIIIGESPFVERTNEQTN